MPKPIAEGAVFSSGGQAAFVWQRVEDKAFHLCRRRKS
jgi:hypothetical protein